ncbi:MAG: hypothetical protein CFE44_28170 [Burkholderiales bacterium PBB4]|nr:MAG: hypothetical protein CFE44_28170 [Burkholderiales bacterium PBB4]
MSKPALVIIDVQNDYFEGGAFPLWNADRTLAAAEAAIQAARARDMPRIYGVPQRNVGQATIGADVTHSCEASF